MKKVRLIAIFLILCIVVLPVSPIMASINIDIDGNTSTIPGINLDFGDSSTIDINEPDEQDYYIDADEINDNDFNYQFQIRENRFSTISFGDVNMNAFATMANGTVTVNGNIEGRSNEWVNIIVYEDSKIDFVADTATDSAGNFSFEYVSEAQGDLQIYVMSARKSAPIRIPIALNVSALGNQINISGEKPDGANRWVTVLVADDNNRIDFAADTIANSNGRFEFQYITESWAETLIVRVNAETLNGQTVEVTVPIKLPVFATMVNGQVTVWGNLRNHRNDWVNIIIYDDVNIDFVADTTTDLTGDFSFEYVSQAMDDLRIYIKGANMIIPMRVPIILNVSALGSYMNIRGEIPTKINDWVTVLVMDNNGNIDFAADAVVNANSRFEFNYVTERFAETLTVRVNSPILDNQIIEVELPVRVATLQGLTTDMQVRNHTAGTGWIDVTDVNMEFYILRTDQVFHIRYRPVPDQSFASLYTTVILHGR